MKTIIDFLSTSSGTLTISLASLFLAFLALLPPTLSYLASRKLGDKPFCLEVLKLVYRPLFKSCEPYLFKKIDIENASKFIEVYNKIGEPNSLYIYPPLMDAVNTLNKFINDKNKVGINNYWYLVCDYINRDYDKFCRGAHLRVRSPLYRITNRQCCDKYSYVFTLIKFCYLPITFFICAGVVANALANYMESL